MAGGVVIDVTVRILIPPAASTGDVDPEVLAKCNPCLSGPCLNQGVCHTDLTEVYRCSCPPGFKVRTRHATFC